MKDAILAMFPEIDLIQSPSLRESVLNTYEDALLSGGWLPEDMNLIPFTLDFPEFIFSYADHVHGVTAVSRQAAESFNATYQANEHYRVDMDTVIAGALLHDVGKLVEYERISNGQYVKTAYGKLLRHPASGAIIAARNGCPASICHIIATHAAEGDVQERTPEAIIINKADFINFDIINYLRKH